MSKKSKVSIYVDHASQRWIVRDPEGNFWILPSTTSAWDQRQPFEPTEETDLEPVPGHYTYLLGLTFGSKENNYEH